MSHINIIHTLLAAIPCLFLENITKMNIDSKIPYCADIPDVYGKLYVLYNSMKNITTDTNGM